VTQLQHLPVASDAQVIDWAPGACLVMHRETWRLAGRFDEWLSFLFEDIEWCHRLASRGGRVLIVPTVRIHHEPHQSLGGRWSPERTRYWHEMGLSSVSASYGLVPSPSSGGSCQRLFWQYATSLQATPGLRSSGSADYSRASLSHSDGADCQPLGRADRSRQSRCHRCRVRSRGYWSGPWRGVK